MLIKCKCSCDGWMIDSQDEALRKYWISDDERGNVDLRLRFEYPQISGEFMPGHGVGTTRSICNFRTLAVCKKFVRSIIRTRVKILERSIADLRKLIT